MAESKNEVWRKESKVDVFQARGLLGTKGDVETGKGLRMPSGRWRVEQVMTMQNKQENRTERAFAYPGSAGTSTWVGLVLWLPRLRHISK